MRCPMRRRSMALFAAVAVALAACSSGGGAATPAPGREGAGPPAASGWAGGGAQAGMKPIRLQLQWFPQAQFAGYFAAKDQGFYADEGLDVTILPGAVEVVPATGGAGAAGGGGGRRG